MKRFMLAVSVLALAAGTAAAESSVIDVKLNLGGAGSVIVVECTTCPARKARQKAPVVNGTRVVETEIDGERKRFMLDNMMGGSAVRYVKTPARSDTGGKAADPADSALADDAENFGIDGDSRTSSVSVDRPDAWRGPMDVDAPAAGRTDRARVVDPDGRE